MKTLQKGMTLIELLIVLVVVSIIAVYSISNMSDNIIKAQVGAAFTLTDAIRTKMSLKYATDGNVAMNRADIGLGMPTDTANKHVEQVNVSDGAVIATFAATAHALIAGQTLVMNMIADNDDNSSFLCEGAALPANMVMLSTSIATSSVPVEYIPSGCAP